VPEPGHLPQRPHLLRGNPRLRQPPQPQQVRQVRRVPLIVLDPPVTERLDPQRMRQVHLGPGRLERIDRPVPAVRRLDHNPRILPRTGDHAPQRLRAVPDPDRLELAPVLSHPHQHAALPVQVHPDDLPAVICFRHRGPPLPGGDGCFATSSIRHERRPAPSSHHLVVTGFPGLGQADGSPYGGARACFLRQAKLALAARVGEGWQCGRQDSCLGCTARPYTPGHPGSGRSTSVQRGCLRLGSWHMRGTLSSVGAYHRKRISLLSGRPRGHERTVVTDPAANRLQIPRHGRLHGGVPAEA